MHRIFIVVVLAAIVAGCGGAAVRPESASQSTQATATQSAEPAEVVAEASRKKPKLSCVQ